MAIIFENPDDGQRATVRATASLGALLLGPLYFVARGIWSAAALFALVAFGPMLIAGPLIVAALELAALWAMAVWLAFAVLAPRIVADTFRRHGWTEVPADRAS